MSMVSAPTGVFISYAREDSQNAMRLYKDLKNAGINPWLDKESLIAGQNWEIAIRKAIKNNKYFIPLLSSNSVHKRGFVQKEFNFALEVLDEIPESDIFVIPARLDDCDIPFEKLKKYHYVDLFPDWRDGIKKILKAMEPTLPVSDVVSSKPSDTTINVNNISNDEKYYHVRIYIRGRGDYYETDLTRIGLTRAIVDPYRRGKPFYFSNAGIIDSMNDIWEIEIRHTKEVSSVVMKKIMLGFTGGIRRLFKSKTKLVFEEGLNVTREFIYFTPGSADQSK
jgi:hypothetical protein